MTHFYCVLRFKTPSLEAGRYFYLRCASLLLLLLTFGWLSDAALFCPAPHRPSAARTHACAFATSRSESIRAIFTFRVVQVPAGMVRYVPASACGSWWLCPRPCRPRARRTPPRAPVRSTIAGISSAASRASSPSGPATGPGGWGRPRPGLRGPGPWGGCLARGGGPRRPPRRWRPRR